MSWGEEWGDEKKRHRPDSSSQPTNEEQRRWERQQAKNESYWSQPREIGEARYRPRGPRLAPGQQDIEHSVSKAMSKVGVQATVLWLCGPCKAGRHADCPGTVQVGVEDVICECSDDAHWIQGWKR